MKVKDINLTKKNKITISVVVLLVVAIIVSAITIKANSTQVYANLIYSFMPKSVQGEIDGRKIEFFILKDENFDPKKDKNDYLKAYRYYYYDKDGNRIDLDYDDQFEEGDQKFNPSILFLYKAAEKWQSVKGKLVIAGVVIAAVLLVIIILLWFKSWSKRQDEQKAAAHKNNSKRKRK
ncbi:MAG: hypothetical protein ACI4RR_02235 [Eubacterium sp.]